ncbi:MAG TPA: response regulator transcription factor [Acidimicrobiales bacterium]|nr:response regulator transcription factor [Acidimicrobiales bacterium]
MTDPEATPARILVVDDDEPTRTMLQRLLSWEGYVIEVAGDGPAALAMVEQDGPDLVLLDVMMPGQDGLSVLAELRKTSDVPVIFLTAKGDEGDRVLGLRSGADDYVVKPFSTAELVARIEAVLRRTDHHPVGGRPATDLVVDQRRRIVTVRGQVVDLPPREFDLLAFLAASPGQVFSREQLLSAVWPSAGERPDPGTVTEHARRLRQRIEEDPDEPRWIRTIRGIGYRFDP